MSSRKALYAVLIAIALWFAISFRGCEPDRVLERPVAPTQTQVTVASPSVSVATAAASNSTRIVYYPPKKRVHTSGLPAPQEDEDVGHFEIVVSQESSVSAPVVVQPPVIVTPPAFPAGQSIASDPAIDHSRLEVVVGTVPGVVAVGVQVLRGQPLAITERIHLLPPELAHVECSVDVEANLQQAGVMATAGGKVFVGVGYALGYNLTAGPFLAAGMRF